MTLPEVLLWQALRGRPGGFKFRRQHPIDPYVADFYCPASGLVVELDGLAHDGAVRQERDAARDAHLKALGYSVIRITATDVLRDLAAVVQHILVRAGSPLHQPSAGPPPRAGEEC